MTELADEIRAATNRDELHEAVAKSYASPRGLCNAHDMLEGGGVAFCTLDYGHGNLHANGRHRWILEWPPAT